MTRQQKWQIEKMKQGKCPICGKKLNGHMLCDEHLELRRKSNLKKYRSERGIPLDKPVHRSTDTRSRNRYRMKHGIPLDAPLHARTSKSKYIE